MDVEKKQATWRAWYRRNKKKMKRYYRKRYQDRKKNETPAQKKVRLAKSRRYHRKYVKKNRQKINEQRRKWRRKHPAKVKARRKKYYRKHHEEILRKGRVRAKKWRSANPARISQLKRASWLMRQYGLAIKDYEEMLLRQNNHCLLCPKSARGRTLNVFRDVKGTVIGLVCNSCRFKETWRRKRCATSKRRRTT